LLREKGLLPELSLQVHNIVCALDEELQGHAAMAANILREKGQSVDLVLESKPLKWYKLLLLFLFNFWSIFFHGL
jgi:histidyl-tRNA synthetase